MQSTRQEILGILKEERQATVEDLAQRLELTPMTIRHHLNVLQAQSMVEAARVRRSQRVGRPRLVYTLTESADALRLTSAVDPVEPLAPGLAADKAKGHPARGQPYDVQAATSLLLSGPPAQGLP